MMKNLRPLCLIPILTLLSTVAFAVPAAGQIRHVVWVWFENRETEAITPATAPTFANFAADNANFTNFYGVSHPSEPNYVAAFSGSTQNILDDGHYSFPATVDNLAKQMSAAGRSWRVFAQNFPGNCFDEDIDATAGADGPGVGGLYVRKHNPAMTFQSVTANPVECANVRPLADFDPTVDFALVVPNQTNNMHDGTTAQGDAFLQQFLPLVANSPDFAHTLLIVTFDEGTTAVNGGGHIYTAAAAPWLHNKTIAGNFNHYDMLRTIEDVFGLPYLGNAATGTTIREILPPAAVAADFDGDWKTDVSIYRPAAGQWWYQRSSDAAVRVRQFGTATDRIVPGDYDGDGKTDAAVFRPATGEWFVLRSSNLTYFSLPFGIASDTPAPGDYDGDGRTDPAVYRDGAGTWFVLKSTGGVSFINFGTSGDLPVAADYDADGRTDAAIFRPATGEWWLRRSTDGVIVLPFGSASDRPVPADYTGDGRPDVAFYRPATGFWFVFRSEDFTYFSFPFGTSGDLPAPGDYDGDGRADAAVFRPATSEWFINRSTAGVSIRQFGTVADRPVPNAFVP
ncbi:MAG: VCBS repeat-containing protein [Acidobacteria bacterium]|nr:VCBS repeat-containing protein [Acidobacteriota bacterium]